MPDGMYGFLAPSAMYQLVYGISTPYITAFRGGLHITQSRSALICTEQVGQTKGPSCIESHDNFDPKSLAHKAFFHFGKLIVEVQPVWIDQGTQGV